MADRTGAYLFARIFAILADNPTAKNRALAWEFWDETGGYDFAPYQMDADDDLVKLGLAVWSKDEDDHDVLLYPDDENGPTRPETFKDVSGTCPTCGKART